jgi:hypothetical protein
LRHFLHDGATTVNKALVIEAKLLITMLPC